MEKWLVENMIWVGLALGIILLGSKYIIVHVYRRLVALDQASEEKDQPED